MILCRHWWQFQNFALWLQQFQMFVYLRKKGPDISWDLYLWSIVVHVRTISATDRKCTYIEPTNVTWDKRLKDHPREYHKMIIKIQIFYMFDLMCLVLRVCIIVVIINVICNILCHYIINMNPFAVNKVDKPYLAQMSLFGHHSDIQYI